MGDPDAALAFFPLGKVMSTSAYNLLLETTRRPKDAEPVKACTDRAMQTNSTTANTNCILLIINDQTQSEINYRLQGLFVLVMCTCTDYRLANRWTTYVD